MSDLAIYQHPTFRVHELAQIHVQGIPLTVRVKSGEQSLETGEWTYYVALRRSYDEVDRHNDGDLITSFYIGTGAYTGVNMPMFKYPTTLTHGD